MRMLILCCSLPNKPFFAQLLTLTFPTATHCQPMPHTPNPALHLSKAAILLSHTCRAVWDSLGTINPMMLEGLLVRVGFSYLRNSPLTPTDGNREVTDPFASLSPLKKLVWNQGVLIDVYVSHPKFNVCIPQEEKKLQSNTKIYTGDFKTLLRKQPNWKGVLNENL